MAVANSLDWSLAATITRKTVQFTHHSASKTKIGFRFISILFLNPNSNSSRAARADPSAVIEDDAAVGDSPVIELALKLEDFHHLPEDDADCKELNSIICSLFKDPQTEHLAYDYYRKAKTKPGFKPQKYTMKLAVRYLIRTKNWSLLVSFCQDLKEFQVLPDKSTSCRLIAACVKARKFKILNHLLQLFMDNNAEMAVLAFDSAMKGYNQLHMYSSSVALYQRMRSAALNPDAACYCRVMEAYFKMGNFQKSVAIFQEFEKMKLKVNESSSTNHSRIYCILCEALGKLEKPFEALEYFREMGKKGIEEDHSHYSTLISSFANAGELGMAEELMQEAESKKMLRDPALFLKLVLKYVEKGMMEKTLDVVATMNRVNIRVSDCIFCAIVNGYVKKRGGRAAVQVYEDLVEQGLEPGQVTYASALSTYVRLGLYPKAEMVFAEMEKKGFDKCVVAYSSMVAAYAKMGRNRDATRLVAKMKEKGCEPNVWTYNSLLDMHGKNLELKMVDKVWKEMKRRKIEPDRVSYTTVISAYHKARELDLCIKYYEEFKARAGAEIDRALAGIMVSVLSKTNRVDELVELLQLIKAQKTNLDERFHRSAMNALTEAGLQVQAKWLQENFEYS
ncbi:pentatricopeptide repeat-containing protein At5g13770, chloroplastic [Salvia miltiorrhiza]|uniref:pentatricopeptide repeat-containing protein At5g13770, chloroplastic n=1 Tax=Salvia miltiorrhiza TaxID=226208 RepID=UPI0025ACEAB1|nr:pentatricopeptide repeat-containing protein At5g13770, chloroplastic [Salvia miltiorrhiza]